MTWARHDGTHLQSQHSRGCVQEHEFEDSLVYIVKKKIIIMSPKPWGDREVSHLHSWNFNAGTHNWSKCQEYRMAECSALNKTDLSIPSRFREYH